MTITYGIEWKLYQQMYTIRRTEETLLELFSTGLLFGTVHTCIGQEACAVGVINALDKTKDVIWSNHRGHGHYISYINDVEGLVAEIMGKSSGVCHGVGGSQHLHNHNFYTNGVLGGTVACAVGSAFAEKEKKTGAITVVFLGDGAMGEGIVYESLNMASLWNLPILFVLEHNQYAQSTPTALAHAGDITLRPKAFNIETKTLKADNVLSIYKTAQEIVNKVRNQQKPFFLSLQTYRYAPHSKGDDFRSKKEIENQKKTDPLQHLRWALDQIHSDRLISIEENIETRILRAVDSAKLAESYPPHAFFKEKQV
ncbi:MAG: thiamine pyrophosphate-dependent dehydrogenase E1 component subunit alpha [Anaerolineaceae bacterium]|nr:thiamine pyrophosphate-dependent dehydrogenase E1 component subunit alpha [Anaerolineaceae bacterium]